MTASARRPCFAARRGRQRDQPRHPLPAARTPGTSGRLRFQRRGGAGPPVERPIRPRPARHPDAGPLRHRGAAAHEGRPCAGAGPRHLHQRARRCQRKGAGVSRRRRGLRDQAVPGRGGGGARREPAEDLAAAARPLPAEPGIDPEERGTGARATARRPGVLRPRRRPARHRAGRQVPPRREDWRRRLRGGVPRPAPGARPAGGHQGVPPDDRQRHARGAGAIPPGGHRGESHQAPQRRRDPRQRHLVDRHRLPRHGVDGGTDPWRRAAGARDALASTPRRDPGVPSATRSPNCTPPASSIAT